MSQRLFFCFLFLILPLLSIAQKEIPCSQYPSYRSLKSDSISKIRFVNQSGAKVKVYWLNHLGEKVLFRTLEPQAEAVQQTYVSHAWLLTWENGECIKAVVAQSGKHQEVVINETAPKALAGDQKAVINDLAANAIPLTVDGSFHLSNTSHCTLQEECLNRRLTAKYIVYHNDQWFTFTTNDADVYYIVVKNQDCRDVKGVQVIVFDGTICQPASYQLIKAVSFATQDDIYISLENLKKNHSYILNLDGYLEDHCAFEIAVSTKLPSFHISEEHKSKVTHQSFNDSIRFDWEISDELRELGVQGFEVMRRYQSEKKFGMVGQVLAERLVRGTYQNNYSYTDTVRLEGFYYYKIIAIGLDGQRYLLGEYAHKVAPHVKSNDIIYPKLDVKEKTLVTVEIYDWYHNTKIATFEKRYASGFRIELYPYFSSSRQRLKVVIKDSKGKVLKELKVDKDLK